MWQKQKFKVEFVYVGNKETEQKFREAFLKLYVDAFWKQVEEEVKNIKYKEKDKNPKT